MTPRQIEDLTVSLQQHAVCRKTTSGLTMLFDRAKGVMYELNESASAIVELLGSSPTPVRDIVDTLCDQFDAPREDITADVERFVDEFVEADMLKAS